jgi:hypothetical protein
MKLAFGSFVLLVVAVALLLLGAGTEPSGWLLLTVVAMVTLAVCLALVAGVSAAFDSKASADRRVASCGVASVVILIVGLTLWLFLISLNRALS